MFLLSDLEAVSRFLDPIDVGRLVLANSEYRDLCAHRLNQARKAYAQVRSALHSIACFSGTSLLGIACFSGTSAGDEFQAKLQIDKEESFGSVRAVWGILRSDNAFVLLTVSIQTGKTQVLFNLDPQNESVVVREDSHVTYLGFPHEPLQLFDTQRNDLLNIFRRLVFTLPRQRPQL